MEKQKNKSTIKILLKELSKLQNIKKIERLNIYKLPITSSVTKIKIEFYLNERI